LKQEETHAKELSKALSKIKRVKGNYAEMLPIYKDQLIKIDKYTKPEAA